jgi:TldD protein
MPTTPGGEGDAAFRAILGHEPALFAALAILEGLRKAGEVRYAEVRYVDGVTERLRVRDGRPEDVTHVRQAGVGVRVLGTATWGFASTASLDEASVVQAARRAVAIARASSRVSPRKVAFPALPPARGTYATALGEDPFAVPLETKLAFIEAPVKTLLAKGRPIQSAEAWMDWSRVTKRLLTTEGTDVTQSFTYGACGMHAFAVADDGSAQRRSYPTFQGGDGFQGGYELAKKRDLAGHAERVREEAIQLLTAPPCPAGPRALVLESSQVALQIHESCGHPTELDRALGSEISLAGGSFLQPGLLGKLTYGSPHVTLVADATRPGGLGTFGWDDEGVPAGEHRLVDRGLFVDYLSSRETAHAIGRRSTGTMRAETYARPPLIRMVNVSLLASPNGGSLDDLVADTADGVYMETDKSWSIDDLRLNFQFTCEVGWEIKKGKKTRMLRDPMYTGVTPRFWGSCDAVCGEGAWRLWGVNNCGKGDPMQIMPVGHGAAPARFTNVEIGGSEGGR